MWHEILYDSIAEAGLEKHRIPHMQRSKVQVRTKRRVQNKPNMLCGFHQSHLGQLMVEKYRTISADLMRQYDTGTVKNLGSNFQI